MRGSQPLARFPSPFRYPGGKAWLSPWIVGQLTVRASVFVEPFAGGGSVSLAVAMAGLADRVVMTELDADVAAVWQVALGDQTGLEALCARIKEFQMSPDSVAAALGVPGGDLVGVSFRTLLANRVRHGGILAKTAGLTKVGENGRGLGQRWYPETLINRLRLAHSLRDRIEFVHGYGFEAIERHADDQDAVIFADPPYTAGSKSAGRRLYRHWDLDHGRLFALMASVRGTAIMTYDDAPEVRSLAARHGFSVQAVAMRNAHNAVMTELLLTKNLPVILADAA